MEDDQQFCLRWNNHQTTLIQNFDTLLESGTLVDCTLAAEGKYLKAHKVVLSACSPYFEGLLSEHYDKHPVFILKDVKFKELKAMMDYMYRGEVNISQDQLAALLKAAESLQIKGLSESRTGGNGCPKPDTRQSKVSSQSTAPSLDIPHASSGLTIEKNSKVPRQSLAQSSVGDLPEDSASPSIPKGISSREGSQSPVSRKRKRLRRRSVGEDNSIENHESNSSDMTQQAIPALGVAPVADEKSHADPADSLGRSALMQQLTKPADEMLQLPVEKPEPTEDMIQPKSEYLDDPEESVEDLTLDDDMNDLNEMEDSNRAGPSSHDPNQHPGLAAWHVTGDRSNAGGVGSVAGGPGTQDEVFLAAHEAVQAQRDSQDSMGIPSANPPSNFEFVDFAISELQPILARDFALQEKETEVEQQQKKRLKQEEDESNRYSSNFQKYVVKELIRIRSQLEDIQHGQQQLANKLNSAGVIEPTPLDAIDKFMEEYSLTLPFKTVGDFERFDVTLAANPTLRAKFMSSLLDLFDRNHVATKTLVNIMKKYMSRDVALSYTAVKPVKDKYVLKGTTFCKCIISVLLKNHIDKNTGIKATEHNLLSALGSVLANAKDWEGYRARRSKPVPRYDDF